MATKLEKDLEKYVNELYETKDVLKGLKILSKIVFEIAAVVTLVAGSLAFATGIIGPPAWLASPTLIRGLQFTVARQAPRLIHEYANLSKKERKYVRAVLNRFDLVDMILG